MSFCALFNPGPAWSSLRIRYVAAWITEHRQGGREQKWIPILSELEEVGFRHTPPLPLKAGLIIQQVL